MRTRLEIHVLPATIFLVELRAVVLLVTGHWIRGVFHTTVLTMLFRMRPWPGTAPDVGAPTAMFLMRADASFFSVEASGDGPEGIGALEGAAGAAGVPEGASCAPNAPRSSS